MLNNTEMHVLSFGSQFEMFSCFVLGKCSVSRPQVARRLKMISEPGSLHGIVVY